MLEKVVFLSSVFEKFLSGFQSHHSTETALLNVLNDIRMNSDASYCTVGVLLDLLFIKL